MSGVLLQGFVITALWVLLSGNNTSKHVEAEIYQIFNKPNLRFGLERDATHKLVCFYVFDNDINPDIMEGLCTHINVGFFGINRDNNTIEVSQQQEEILNQVVSLKEMDQGLKILISVGGAGDVGFSSMVLTHARRKMFIKSCMGVLKKFKIDGIDLDWEWPVVQDGNSKEKVKFVQLLQEIRDEFNRHRKVYVLTADVSSALSIIELSYYVNHIADYVDFVNVMCYDYHYFTKFYPFTGLNSPLYSTNENLLSTSINQSIYFWISNSMPREKIVLGIPTYGHTFELIFPHKNSLAAPAKGFGSIGEDGFADYQQICEFLKLKNPTVIYENVSKVPYAYHSHEWISYDDEDSLAIKMSGEEEMIICPYNTAHAILKSRMATHLIKCRQQHPVERYETCPFNSTHDVPLPELQYHTKVCPDRRQLEKCIYVLGEPEPLDESNVNIKLPSSSENWDEDTGASGSYLNVKDKELEKQQVFRQPIGMSRNEKKTFHIQEVHRFVKASETGSTTHN